MLMNINVLGIQWETGVCGKYIWTFEMSFQNLKEHLGRNVFAKTLIWDLVSVSNWSIVRIMMWGNGILGLFWAFWRQTCLRMSLWNWKDWIVACTDLPLGWDRCCFLAWKLGSWLGKKAHCSSLKLRGGGLHLPFSESTELILWAKKECKSFRADEQTTSVVFFWFVFLCVYS